jgi:glutaredoxin
VALVEIFSKEGCHLCEIARDAVHAARKRHPFELREVTLVEGHPLYDTFGVRVPVITINGTFAFQYKVSEAELLERLRAIEPHS